MEGSDDLYTPVKCFITGDGDIVLRMCRRCGAAIWIVPTSPWHEEAIHNQWHRKLEEPK